MLRIFIDFANRPDIDLRTALDVTFGGIFGTTTTTIATFDFRLPTFVHQYERPVGPEQMQ